MRATPFIASMLLLSCGALLPAAAEPPVAVQRAYETRTVRVPNTTVSFEMVHTPAAEDGSVPAMWVLKTEVPWELYDIFVYRLDKAEGEADADGVARPSKPYVPPDRGFGHDGYPAIGMTRQAAEAFCVWLSKATGTAFRLPTEAEWVHVASPGASSDAAMAWTSANAEFTTHPVGKKCANEFGLHDMIGNVAEWVMSDGRRPIAMGGSYLDAPKDCSPDSKQQQERGWNASDPQIPKSQWWLADCSWVGFRFVTEEEPGQDAPEPDEKKEQDDEH
jgi:formylglycine-generating enzyme required for sulfatase activity